MQRLLAIAICLIFSTGQVCRAEGDCTLEVLVAEGSENVIRQVENFDIADRSVTNCVVVIHRWSWESLNDNLRISESDSEDGQDANARQVLQFNFTHEPSLNFAVVNARETFVLNFDESDHRWPFIPTMFSRDKLNEWAERRVLTKAGFYCNVKAGVHRVTCLNSEHRTIGRVLVVPKYAEEYQVVMSGENIHFEPGRVDVSVWLGEKWHPMRFSGAVRPGVLRLQFETEPENVVDPE